MHERFKSFSEFYPYYLSEHSDPRCRALHYLGSSLVIGMLVYIVFSGYWGLWWILPLLGYGFAWIGHFVFEKNRPATFSYPLYSFMGDWLMWWQFITAQRR